MANLKWSGRLFDMERRVAELELIVTEKHRPPSRLGTTFRYLVENIGTLREIIERHKSSAQNP
jgi:hypothetical protein